MPKLTTLPTVTVALALLTTLISSIPGGAAAAPWHNFTAFAGCRKGITTAGLSNIKKYFQLFGYLNSSYHDFSDDFDDYLESAVKTYQRNFNLNATGELDSQTLRHVVLPRCGNPDAVNGTSTMRSGRQSLPGGKNSNLHTVAHYSFFPNQPRWPPGRTRLTYAFQPENQLSDSFRGAFRRAFQRWSEVTPLTFMEAAEFSGADIQIGFHSGEHGDGEPFDGVLGTLAHAFSPPSGRLHLDNDEHWVVDGEVRDSSAVDLESVAVHEIGHLLGLGHSSVEDAIMYPTISTGTRKLELASDDILGIQELYGSNPNYNGSDPVVTARGERDTNGVTRVEHPLWAMGVLLAVGLFSCSIL